MKDAAPVRSNEGLKKTADTGRSRKSKKEGHGSQERARSDRLSEEECGCRRPTEDYSNSDLNEAGITAKKGSMWGGGRSQGVKKTFRTILRKNPVSPTQTRQHLQIAPEVLMVEQKKIVKYARRKKRSGNEKIKEKHSIKGDELDKGGSRENP